MKFTRTFTFKTGEPQVFEYEKGDMAALEALTDTIIQDLCAPEKTNDQYINPIVAVHDSVVVE